MQLIVFLFLLIFTGACSQNSVSSLSGQAFLTEGLYVNGSSTLRVYRLKPSDPTYITDLLASDSLAVSVPRNILKNEIDDRTQANKSFSTDLILKVYNESSKTPDFYFETQILGSTVSPTNVTTALSWLLRYSFSGQTILFNDADFQQSVVEVEARCNDCRKKTNSEIVRLILSDSNILNSFLEKVSKHNPQLNLAGANSDFNYQPPTAEYAFSKPQLFSSYTSKIETAESKNISLEIVMTAPQNSAEKILPVSWSHDFNSALENINASLLNYQTTYTDKGTHIFEPKFNPTISLPIKFEIEVENQNRKPICNEIKLTFNTNRYNEALLSTKCSDLDPEDILLKYNLISGPPGLTISTDGILRWLVSEANYVTSPLWKVRFGITDPLLGYGEYEATINLVPDHYPTITLLNPSATFTEGQETTLQFSVVDPDGDPVILVARPITSLADGLPAGANILNNFSRTGSNGNYTFTFKFTPSYMQTIGSDGNLALLFEAKYDPLNPNLNSTLKVAQLSINLPLTNIDDPPYFVSQPPDTIAAEGTTTIIEFNADAIDPSPSTSAISYRVNPVFSSTYCTWTPDHFFVEVLAGKVRVHIYPEYQSSRECFFSLQVVDGTGLVGTSNSFKVEVTDTNQPITKLASAPTLITGLESQRVNLKIDEMFEDLDFTAGDIDEELTWQCFLDQDLDGQYTDSCSGTAFRPSLNRDNLSGYYLPGYYDAGTYNVRLIATDKGGAIAQHDFQVVISDSPTPMNLSFALNGDTPTDFFEVTENNSYSLEIKAIAASTDPIDIYDFTIDSPTCSVINASGSCPVALLSPNNSLDGNGSQSFFLTIAPSFLDGDDVFPKTNKTYSYSFIIQKKDDPLVTNMVNIAIKVNNTNRPPTALNLSTCTNCSLVDAADGSVNITINALADTKAGLNWLKTYKTRLSLNDADTNDSPTAYFAATSASLGSISEDFYWSFKLPSCVNPHPSATVNRNIILEGSDGRGGTVQRSVNLIIQKATAGTTCLTP